MALFCCCHSVAFINSKLVNGVCKGLDQEFSSEKLFFLFSYQVQNDEKVQLNSIKTIIFIYRKMWQTDGNTVTLTQCCEKLLDLCHNRDNQVQIDESLIIFDQKR